MNLTALNEQAVRISGMLADCSDQLDSLESLLDSAEQICPQAILDEYAQRVATSAGSR